MPKSKQTVLRIALFAVIVGCIVGLIVVHPFASPVLASTTRDLGVLDAGTVTHVTLSIVNSSFRPVHIKRVTSACQCTLASGIPEYMRARSRCSADVTIRVKDLEGPATWSIALDYGDGQRAIHTFKGNVIRPVPNEVVFPEYRQGEQGSKTFFFRSIDGPPAEIERLNFDEAYFDVHTEPVLGALGELKVVVSESKSIPMGGFDKFLILTAKTARSETTRAVKLRGTVTPCLVAEPTRIVDTFRSNLLVLTKTVRLRAPYGGDIKLTGCRAEPSELVEADLSAARADADGSLLLPVRFRRPAKGEYCIGSVSLQGKAAGRPASVNIEVYLAVSSR